MILKPDSSPKNPCYVEKVTFLLRPFFPDARPGQAAGPNEPFGTGCATDRPEAYADALLDDALAKRPSFTEQWRHTLSDAARGTASRAVGHECEQRGRRGLALRLRLA